MATETGQVSRKSNMFDADLILRPSGDAPITTLAGSFSAPDYEGAILDIGEGQFMGRVVIQNLAFTKDVLGDNRLTIALRGWNEAESVDMVLAALLIGDDDLPNSDNTLQDGVPIDFMFNNANFGQLFPKVQLIVVGEGTATGFSLDFDAFIARLN